jgi:hypothetical protein
MMMQNLAELVNLVNVSLIPFADSDEISGSQSSLTHTSDRRKSSAVVPAEDILKDIGMAQEDRELTTLELQQNFQRLVLKLAVRSNYNSFEKSQPLIVNSIITFLGSKLWWPNYEENNAVFG